VLKNGGIGPDMPVIPDNPMVNMRPNSLIHGARYDQMMDAFGGQGFFVEDPKDLNGASPKRRTSAARRWSAS
jgi:2-hydroxyacyl-CoA lyase 1